MKVRCFDAWIGGLIRRQAWNTWMLRMAMLHNGNSNGDMRMRAFVIPQGGVILTALLSSDHKSGASRHQARAHCVLRG